MTDDPTRPRPHTLDDHLLGMDAAHSHEDGESDHDHDHDDVGGDYDPTATSLWLQDHLSLVSVGIDIGSAGTQVVFSRVRLRRMSEELTSRYVVVARETLHQSPVVLTPYASEERIDEQAIGRVVDEAYGAARIHPDDVDTGAVILTGEALRRDNARAIADVLAEVGGEFVCAAAGHHMEARLAAYGSGAAQVSHAMHAHLLNIDIGGGTTKLALIDDGHVVRTGAIHLGGRLAVAEGGRLVRLDPAGRRIAGLAGCDWTPGGAAGEDELDRIGEWMADALVAALTGDPARRDVAELWLTDPVGPMPAVRGVMFSGGVGEYVYGREERDFSDLGRRLGLALRRRIDEGRFPFAVLPPGECIRATALGASEYSVQLSGNTICLSSPGVLLPRKNLQVVRPRVPLGEGPVDAAAVAAAIRDHLRSFDIVEGEAEVALAIRWSGPPAYARLAGLARGIAAALPRTIAEGKPLFLIFDGDIAQTIGAILRGELGVTSEVLALDGIALWDFDYIDLGRVRMPSFTVPVTIKSLVFSADPRMPHTHGHTHGHAHHHHAHPHSHDHASPHHDPPPTSHSHEHDEHR